MTKNQTYTMMRDQLCTMFRIEATYNSSHIVTKLDSIVKIDCNCEWREKICMWCYQLIDYYHYDREVVSFAMDYLDRYLTSQHKEQIKFASFGQRNQSFTPIQLFQLTTMTCLYIAIKLHAEVSEDPLWSSTFLSNHKESQHFYVEPYHKEVLQLKSYVTFSGGQFTENDILRMEEQILAKLKWKVNPVTALKFVSYLTKFIPYHEMVKQQEKIEEVSYVLFELSLYLTELAICLPSISEAVKTFSGKDGTVLTTRAYAHSSIAYASMLVSMDLITVEAFPLKLRRGFTQQVSEIAFEASSFSHDQEYLFFKPVGKEIGELKNILLSAIRHNKVLEGTIDGGQESLEHPISVAKMAGFLNTRDTSREEVQKTSKDYRSPRNHNIINQGDNGKSPICVSRILKDISHSKKRSRSRK